MVTVCQSQTVFVLAEVGFCGEKHGGYKGGLRVEEGRMWRVRKTKEPKLEGD